MSLKPVVLKDALCGDIGKIEAAAMQMKMIFQGKKADGAIPNGHRIKKINSNTDDTNQDGTLGTIYASIGPEMNNGRLTIGYIILWDTYPGIPVLITDDRIEKV